MPNVFIENFEEFTARMDCSYVVLPPAARTIMRDGQVTDERHLFENGGLSDGARKHVDPPTDANALLNLQHLYWTTKRNIIRDKHSRLLNDVSTQNDWHRMGVGPSAEERYPQWSGHLENLAIRIGNIDKQIAEIVPKLPTTVRDKAIGEKQHKLRMATEATREEIRKHDTF